MWTMAQFFVVLKMDSITSKKISSYEIQSQDVIVETQENML